MTRPPEYLLLGWHVWTKDPGVGCRETYIKGVQGESPNDRNDRAIRVAAAWYARKLPSMPILLISNDADNLRRAKAEGLNAMGVQVRPL